MSTKPAKIDNKPAERRPRGNPAWRKGVSGNPGGRPKGSAEVRELARSHTAAAIEALVSIVGNDDSPPAARVSAAQALLDRGWGKPTQMIASDEEAGGLTVVIRKALGA
jgi:hypothetical protein